MPASAIDCTGLRGLTLVRSAADSWPSPSHLVGRWQLQQEQGPRALRITSHLLNAIRLFSFDNCPIVGDLIVCGTGIATT